MLEKYDIVIIGAGIYGMHIALNNLFHNKKVLIIEKDNEMLTRASFVNQARLHNGYHYPRSEITARNSARYFEKFYKDYQFAINKESKSIYAISNHDSYTTKKEFEEFCNNVNIPYKEIDSSTYFNEQEVSATYETKEYVYDINLIKNKYEKEISERNNIDIYYNTYIETAKIQGEEYLLELSSFDEIKTKRVINTTYASVNQVNEIFNIKKFDIKYELAEVGIGNVSENLKNTAITIMDGPFFSIMPFGKTGKYSITSVCHTPHETSYRELPEFKCQEKNLKCTKQQLENCNKCEYKPKSKVDSMLKLYKKFVKDEYEFLYKESLFAIKPILKMAENDDARPTIVIKHREKPDFISCLSGKFNTIYILDEFIEKNLK